MTLAVGGTERRPMSDQLSIIIPVLNESVTLPNILESLQPLRLAGVEVIVSDGGSSDDSITIAEPLTDAIVRGFTGRAAQMNAAAKSAKGDWILFLHADSVLPVVSAQTLIQSLVDCQAEWGWFKISIAGRHPGLRLTAWLMNRRSKLTSIATGDQGLFVRAKLFRSCEGFPEQLLMEDIGLSQRLKALAEPGVLKLTLTTSGRRWETHGWVSTVVKMSAFRLLYWLGVSPTKLHRWYQNVR